MPYPYQLSAFEVCSRFGPGYAKLRSDFFLEKDARSKLSRSWADLLPL